MFGIIYPVGVYFKMFIWENVAVIPTVSIPIFANLSIRDKEVVIPDISHVNHFVGNILSLLESAHQDTKQELSDIRKQKAYTGPNADKYIELCRLNIQQFLEMDQLGKKFKDYETPISVRAYKRLSMIYEKQGNYENAFEICIEAIKNGIEYDGTKSGFKERAARMIKKAGITPDEETVNILMQ